MKMSCATNLGLLLSAAVTCVVAYKNGAPLSKCSSMTPGHLVSAQQGPSPYTLNLSSPTFCPNRPVTVTIQGTEDFKGFLCQPRKMVDTYETSGQLASADTWSVKNNCDKAALTHGNNDVKNSLQMTWTPDATYIDPIYIVCTIVKEKVTFWVKQTSEAITYAGSDACDDQGVAVTCSKDLDCSGMTDAKCVAGKCTISGAKESTAFSVTLILGTILLRQLLSL